MPSWKSGSRGKVDVHSGTVLPITGWSFDPKAELHEVSNTSSNEWEEFIAGFKGATCSFTANWDVDAHPTESPANLTPGTTVALKLYIGDTAEFIGCTAIIEGLPMVSAIKDTLKYTCNARVTGVVNWPGE